MLRQDSILDQLYDDEEIANDTKIKDNDDEEDIFPGFDGVSAKKYCGVIKDIPTM